MKTSNDDINNFIGNLYYDGSTHTRCVLIKNKNQKIIIDPQKISAEELNGRFALLGITDLVGAYITTGQIVPEII